MAMVVQHNITAMNASRMLGITTGQQAKQSEKLSSGYRINRASDDAAGLSISEKMRSQIRGLNRASTNAQDGVSAVQTAEGALTEVHSMLQRMNELAVQSANGTNSKVDREAIQAEVDQLTKEIDRVAESTKFNETYLLKGDEAAGTKTIYAYKEIEASVEITNDLYAEGDKIGTVLSEEEVLEKIAAGEKLYSTKATITTQDGADQASDGAGYTVTNATATQTNGTGFAATYDNTKVTSATYTYVTGHWEKDGSTVDLNDEGITLDGGYTPADGDVFETTAATVTADVPLYAEDGLEALSADDIRTAVLAGDDLYTVAATVDQTEATEDDYTYTPAGKAVLYDEKGKALSADELSDILADGGKVYDKDGNDVAEADLTTYAEEAGTVNADLELSLHVGADAADTNKIEISIKSMSAAGIGVNDLDVSTIDTATAAIDTIKAAIQKVSDQRSALGAVQNRLEHTIANLDNVAENTTSSESRIRDTDMASAMVEYSKNNILAQAGQSMLAQANQSTQGILSLLQ